MRLLKTTLFLLLCCLAATGQAQDNPKYDLFRWHIKPGQQQLLIDYLGKVDAKYQAASNKGWEFYRYDNNTLEVLMPIRDYAELDRIQAQFGFARGSLSAEERQSVYDPAAMAMMVTGTEAQVLEMQSDMNYTPTGEEGMDDKLTALQLDRYTYAYGDWDKVKAHNDKYLALMRKAGSPVHMHFMTLDYGNGQTFEVEYLGTDRADLDRRLAEHERLMAGPELDAWVKRAMELAKQVSSTFGTKVTTLGQEAKPSTDRLFAVSNSQVVPGKEAAYEVAMEGANKHLRAGGADLYWATSIEDNGMVRNFAPIRQMSDIDKVYEQMRKRWYQVGPEKIGEMETSFAGMTSSSHITVMRDHTELGYLQDKIDFTPAMSVYKIQVFDYNPDDREKVMAFLEETKKLGAKSGTSSPYQVWSYEMGGPDNRVFIVDYGKDKASIEASIAADMKKMGKDLDGWVKELTSLLTEVESTYGRRSFRGSYLPEAEVK
jgi:hypothetical protein